ncbi:DUF305 domain-containing protein [Microbacterium hominis]|uniref:DUF305 domain-containing protein n=1 Tax=Microbacterium hominis TaxID=162426 RepID=A0A7D4U695_9MICO|nr:DUF305 domain-containing protein [Microbacterium hominis]QKJ18206.1 DUF305 domain-containing protein [Microbacterium hominis]
MSDTVFRAGLVIVLGLGALGLSACTADEPPFVESTAPVVQIGAPGEPNRELSAEEQEALTSPEHVEADVVFIRDMLEHHAQALVMTGLVPDNSDDPDLALLAERMQLSQDAEMDQLEKWLQDRGEAVRDPDGHGHSAEDMPGMLTDAQLAELEAADGAEFDLLFLEYMIQHHEGAIAMVQELYAAGGGMELAVDDIARHVEADQGIEIARMQQMIAERS